MSTLIRGHCGDDDHYYDDHCHHYNRHCNHNVPSSSASYHHSYPLTTFVIPLPPSSPPPSFNCHCRCYHYQLQYNTTAVLKAWNVLFRKDQGSPSTLRVLNETPCALPHRHHLALMLRAAPWRYACLPCGTVVCVGYEKLFADFF